MTIPNQGSKWSFCQIEPSSTSVNFSIQTLLEEIKPVVTDKFEFEYRKKSMELPILEFSDYENSDSRSK